MRSTIMLGTVVLSLAPVFVASCSKKPTDTPPHALDRTMSMTITRGSDSLVFNPEAASLTALRPEPPLGNDHYGVVGGQVIGDMFYEIEFHFPAIPSVPHTFETRPDEADPQRVGVQYGERLKIGGDGTYFFATVTEPGSVSGTVTVTRLSNDRLAGVFSLEIIGDGMGGRSTRSISSGMFDMQLEAFHWEN